ncbi:hypothetical protein B5S33_g3652 [[Candida] boidinii]|nr:hypothetical protein B5S33_g3652 [[Candida] boidinii]GMF99153.1 unnamed protein product [[Candida] boidinii]
MAEKVRFFLEQTVPELQDLERKHLFDKKEITMIMRKRTDFEHRITSRGVKPYDFLKYVKFEKNLEKLRKKRFNRLKTFIDTKASISDWSINRRILFIFKRSINRFPNENQLWSEYIKFCKKNGSVKVIYKAYTNLLQLQPRNINAWLSAAKFEFEYNANAKGARNLLQRSLRFNSESLDLWLNYAKFELNYISKLLSRRKILNLITEKQQLEQLQLEKERKLIENKRKNVLDNDEDQNDLDSNTDIIKFLPDGEDIKTSLNNLPEIDVNVLGNPENNPALKGDIALTIYDVCLSTILKTLNENDFNYENKKIEKILEISNEFLKLFDSFTTLDRNYLCQHIINNLSNQLQNNEKVILLDLTLIIRYVKIDSDDFTYNLQISVKNFLSLISKLKLSKSIENDKKIEIIKQLYIDFLTKNFLHSENPKPTEKLNQLLNILIAKCHNA